MEMKVKRVGDVKVPSYAKAGDAGFDIPSSEECSLKPFERRVIKSGISLAIPSGHVGLIWDRSSMASKFGLHCIGGVIDSGYRGEIGVAIINLSDQDFRIEKGMRIAQMLIQPVVQVDITEVDELDSTYRGQGGFGSTGRRQ